MRSPPLPASADTVNSAGVLSMLKTSTDTGDIGALSFNSSRLPHVPARATQIRQHAIKSPNGSASHQLNSLGNKKHYYAPSAQSKLSSYTRDWDAASGRQGSFTSMQTVPLNTAEPHHTFGGVTHEGTINHDIARSVHGKEHRSYSLTSAPMPRFRSEHSLKGHAPDSRLYDHSQAPMLEGRQPFVYPTRLKRPGYRSPSPALSDSYAQGSTSPMFHQSMQQGSFSPTYTDDFAHVTESTYVGSRSNVPGMVPSAPTSYGPQYMRNPYQPGAPYSPPMRFAQPGNRAAPSIYAQPRFRQMASVQHFPTRHEPYGPQPMQQVPTTGYPYSWQHAQQPSLAPAAHQMFHNAARMARQLPNRVGTPINEMGQHSSDPASSGGTAPSASSPATPQDWTSIPVGVNPAFIDPALTELPESTSDPVIPARYFDYVDGLEHAADDSSLADAHHPSVPPSGFVQRVKAMLESKAGPDVIINHDPDPEQRQMVIIPHAGCQKLTMQNDGQRITVIEEFQAPAELPASPVKIAELEAGPVSPKSASRVTRELVKANLAMTETEDDITAPPLAQDKYDHIEQSTDARPLVSPCEELTMDTTDMPSSPPVRHVRRPSSTHSMIDDSTEVPHQDFAFPFSPAEDTTNLGETETDTKDRFVLDADTITAQNQMMKENAQRYCGSQAVQEPVSPLLTADHGITLSAVSPLRTQPPESGKNNPVEQTCQAIMPTLSIAEEIQPPTTPRSPRGHSKSVNLPSAAVYTIAKAPAKNNRLSLPADFSQCGNTTTEVSTDPMTDIAVRFSMPQATVTTGKPQIVHIPSSSPSSKDDSISQFPPSSTKCNAVAYEEPSPPAVPCPKVPHVRAHSLGPYFSNRQDSDEPEQDSGVADERFDTRFPSNSVVRHRYLGPHLSDLKEESQEDASLRDPRRSVDITNGMTQFQLPARIAAVKAMQERKQKEAIEKNRLRESGRRPRMYAGRPLSEIRDLPSLNFSRVDLVDQLNEALLVRSSKSMEVLHRRALSPIYCPSPQRPQSTEPLRERYMSFFDRPEAFFLNEYDSSDDGDDGQSESAMQNAIVPDRDRPLSPDEHLLAVASQVNRLSVPSVNGLGERLSELLPGLRNLQLSSLLASDRDVRETIENIHNLGRPDTLASCRTSAGFRTLAERAEQLVRNWTGESESRASNAVLLNKNLPALPASTQKDKVAVTQEDIRSSVLQGSASAPSHLGEPARPSSALVRYKTPASEEEVRLMLPPEMNPIARAQRRSTLISSPCSRPWNLDENYP